jgi:predicted metallopeptidase
VPEICKECGRGCGEPCAAYVRLVRLYREIRTEEKKEIIRELRKELGIVDCEVDEEMRQLGEKVIDKFKGLHFIRDYEIRIGYVRSYENKGGRRIKYADCRRVLGAYMAYLPYDYIITFYDNNTSTLTANQRKVLMLHELKHIEITPQGGLGIRPHEVEDFVEILEEYGIRWNEYRADVPDILAGDTDAGE